MCVKIKINLKTETTFLSQLSSGYRGLECDMKIPDSAEYSFMARVPNENLFAKHSECFIIHGIPMWLKIFTSDKKKLRRTESNFKGCTFGTAVVQLMLESLYLYRKQID